MDETPSISYTTERSQIALVEIWIEIQYSFRNKFKHFVFLVIFFESEIIEMKTNTNFYEETL